MVRSTAIVFLALASSVVAQQRQAGFVIQVDSGWKWSNGRAVVPGEAVAPGASAQTTDKKARLTIARLDGSVQSFDCATLNPCKVTIASPQPGPDSLAARVVAVGKAFFEQRTAVPVYAMSRGTGPTLQPAVLALDTAGVELTPVLMNLTVGMYRATLRPLQPPARAAISSRFTWEPPSSTKAVFAGLRPGVYELALQSEEGGRLGSTSVLIAAPGNAVPLRNSFAEGMKIVEGWPAATDPAAIHNFLNALLFSLAANPK